MLEIKAHIPQHLCSTCKFATKCDRLNQVVNTLQSLEVETFRHWKMNLVTTLMIDECDLYKMDFAIVTELAESYSYFQDDDEGED